MKLYLLGLEIEINIRKMKYYQIIGGNTFLLIGLCDSDGIEDVKIVAPDATFRQISRQKYMSDLDRS